MGGSYWYSSKSFEIRFESNLGFPRKLALRPISGSRVYPANRDARARVTEIESMNSGRVHRLDRINANVPAKLLDSKSLTLGFSRKQIWPVYLCDPITKHSLFAIQ